MDSNKVTLVRERFLPKIREVAEILRQHETEALIMVIPQGPEWPIFFVGPGDQQGICHGINTRAADAAYETATRQRRADVAEAHIQP